MRDRLLNYIIYQAGWLCCVMGAARQRPWLGASAALALVAVHVALSRDRLDELKLIAAAAVVGGTLDSVQTGLGVLSFPSGGVVRWVCPVWIVVMWMQFATLFRYCLAWLSGRYALGSALGLTGGPLAFYAGSALGAVRLHPEPLRSFVSLAVGWAIVLPLLLWLSDRLRDGSEPGAYRI